MKADVTITFRNAQIDDSHFIARAILEAVEAKNRSESAILLQTELSRREDVIYSWRNTLLAECNGKVVGSLTSYDGRHYAALRAVTFPLILENTGLDFSEQPNETGPGEYYLDSLYVLPEFRNHGIARALLQEGIARAKAHRISNVTLLVNPENKPAYNLYKKLGFNTITELFAFGTQFEKLSLRIPLQPMLEVCAPSLASARTAERAGAARIELCRDLACGGLTPEHDDIATCVRELTLQTFVLIRPRGGDFCYTEAEFKTILEEIRFCKSVGCHGVVVGFLNSDGSIDVEKSRLAVNAAWPMQVTFHRAFDRCRDWKSALEQIIGCGYSRILTSGQQPTAIQGMETLRQIQLQADGRIAILAGSGVNAENAGTILRETGVTEIHGSCKISGYESDYGEVTKVLREVGSRK